VHSAVGQLFSHSAHNHNWQQLHLPEASFTTLEANPKNNQAVDQSDTAGYGWQ